MVCAQLISYAGRVAKKVIDEAQIIREQKEVFTDADVKVQAAIFKGLKNFWPSLNVIGEEDELYDGPFEIEWSSITLNFFDPKDLFGEKSPEDIPIEKATVWIDPIDGTKNFIQGEFDFVTTLIGLCVDSEPRLGVIGKYYYPDNQTEKLIYSPKCIFGDASVFKVFNFKLTEENAKPTIVSSTSVSTRPKDVIIMSALSRKTEKLMALIESLNPGKAYYQGGAGNSILSVIEDITHAYIHPGSNTKKWDTAAQDAILKCFGGTITNFTGARLNYPRKKENPFNENGLVATKSKALHEEIIAKTSEFES